MKKLHFLLMLALMLVAVPAISAQSAGSAAAKAFADAPQSVFPSIDRMTRLDMIDYFNSGSPKPSKNSFKGDCRIMAMNDSQLTFSTSDVSEVTMSLIPHRNDTIIMVITTLRTPQEDSTAKFYTSSWEEIRQGLFMVPDLDDWMLPDAKDKKEDLENAVPFMLARLTYEPGTGILTVTNTVGGILPEEATSWAGNMLRDKLIYRWDGKKMIKLKD